MSDNEFTVEPTADPPVSKRGRKPQSQYQPDAAEPEPEADGPRGPYEFTGKEKRVKVKFFNSPGFDGSNIIDLQVNEYHYRIPREQVVELPEMVLHSIDNCVIEHLNPVTGQWEKIMRFPYVRV